jgi:hypothetical protein
VLGELGPRIQWLRSYVTDDKIYCVYIAPDEKLIREHAERAGLPGEPDLGGADGHRPDHGREN